MSQQNIQDLIMSVHKNLKSTQDALMAVPDVHAVEVTNCEAKLAEQLRTLTHEYGAAATAAVDESTLVDLERRSVALLASASSLKDAHERLLSTVNQITPASTKYDVPELKLDDRFAGDDHEVFGVGRHDNRPGFGERVRSAFNQGRQDAKASGRHRRGRSF